MDLITLQKQFIKSLGLKTNNLQWADAPSRATAEERLAIYQNTILNAKRSALKKIYRVCNRLVGNGFFNGLANEYISQHPSHSFSLVHYGDDFATTIKQFKPAKSLPYLPDMARLEWAWHQNTFAACSPSIHFQTLAEDCGKLGGDLVFSLPNASVLLDSPYPLHLIWEMNQENAPDDQTVLLPEGATFYYFIWQCADVPRIECLQSMEWQLLHWIDKKWSLEKICETALTYSSDVPFNDLLLMTIQKGWLR